MEILARKGSIVIVKSKSGDFWLTRRVKRKHNGRRQFKYSCPKTIFYAPTKKLTSEEAIVAIYNLTKNKKVVISELELLGSTSININFNNNLSDIVKLIK